MHRRREHVHAIPVKRRAELAQPLARERARHDHRVGLLGQTALPQRQRRAVGGRLWKAAAAVQAHPRQRVAPVTARALRPAREAHADRADDPVLVQVQHDTRSGLARRRQRTPAERWIEIVRMHHTRTAQPHRPRHVLGVQSPPQQPGRRAAPAQCRRVPLQQLRLLSQLLAHERHQVRDHALLAARGAVAVVQEQDHVVLGSLFRRRKSNGRSSIAGDRAPT